MKAVNHYLVIEPIKGETKKVGGLILTDEVNEDNRYLKAKYISLNEDIIEGDILITSGLDNIFPEGYLIGEISNINKNFQKDFLEVTANPVSSLSSNREVMLLW